MNGSIVIKCPKCGENASGNFCSKCGTRLIQNDGSLNSMTPKQNDFFNNFKKRLTDEFVNIEKNPNLSPDDKASRIIYTTAGICAAIAVQPIPFADMPILTSIQAFMGYKLGQVRGLDLKEEGALELLKSVGGVVGLGFAAQQVAIGLYKIGLPGVGGLMSAPLVAGLTYGIGKAMDLYLTMKAKGKTPLPEDIKRAFNEAKKEGRNIKPQKVINNEN